MSYTLTGGTWKNCAECGKKFFVLDCELWAYKRTVTMKPGSDCNIVFFCKYSCKRKFDKKYDEMKANSRKQKGWCRAEA